MSEYRDRMSGFGRDTAPDAAAVARLRARVDGTQAASAWPRRLAWGGSVLAAVALVAFAFRPAPPGPVAEAFHPGAGGPVQLGPLVTAQADGQGNVAGDAQHLRVAWESGTLSLDVTPEQGVALEVQTDEARVRVVGTGFDVVRDALGTAVRVRHGKVQVDCADGSSTLLSTGESRTCLPGTAGGMLGRARALGDAGAGLDEQLRTVEAGLARADAGPLRDELRFIQLGLLVRQEQPAAAMALADGMLRDGQALRRPEVLEAAARMHVDAGDCVGAAPWLAELRVGSEAAPAWAASCSPAAP